MSRDFRRALLEARWVSAVPAPEDRPVDLLCALRVISRANSDIRQSGSWPVIPNSRTSCTARGARIRCAPSCSASWRAKSPPRPSSASPIRRSIARLRAAIIAARAENMTKDVIERAIKKAPGNDAENYDEMRYEGYGPGGVAVIVEVLTDNTNRTAGDVRATFTKSRRQPRRDRRGVVHVRPRRRGRVRRQGRQAPTPMLDAAIEAGAEDVASSDDGHEIYTALDSLARRRQGAGGQVRRAAQGRAGLEAEEHRRGRRRARASSCSACSKRSTSTTTCRTSTPISRCRTPCSPR